MNTITIDFLSVVIILLMSVVVPLIGMWDWRRLQRWTASGRSDARIKSYNWILIMEWGMTLTLLGWWLKDGRNLASLGLTPTAEGWQWLAIGLGLAAASFMIYQLITVLRSPKKLQEARNEMGDLGNLAPQSPEENRLFILVAITAGICEEILYRGFLLVVLIPVVGTWPAVILSSIVFGLGHVYQGRKGIAKTGLVGLVMALLTIFSGSLFIAIVLHSVIDIVSGRIMGQALTASPADEDQISGGVSPSL